MFIRSSTAINDCLIALDAIEIIGKGCLDNIYIFGSDNRLIADYMYQSQEDRDKAFDELCAFLNTNYKLRDFA